MERPSATRDAKPIATIVVAPTEEPIPDIATFKVMMSPSSPP